MEGGLEHAEQFLGLRDSQLFDPSLDIVFVSIDLEVPRQEQGKPGALLVKEFVIATLDNRYVKSLKSPFPAIKYIWTQQFSTSHTSQDFWDCDFTDFKECVFAETLFISQAELPATIASITTAAKHQESNASQQGDRLILVDRCNYISQEDILERNQQANMMTKIYKRATGVHIWLGGQADNCEIAFQSRS